MPAAGKTYRNTAVGARGAHGQMPHAARCPAPECGVTLAANGMDAARTLTLLLTTPRFMSVTAGAS